MIQIRDEISSNKGGYMKIFFERAIDAESVSREIRKRKSYLL